MPGSKDSRGVASSAGNDGEDLNQLVDDPWLVHQCSEGESGCSFTFEDSDFSNLQREVVYYARALQEPTMAINGDNLRCQRDPAGACIAVRPCYSDERTDPGDDCLGEVMERAWSSPIWVTPASG